MCDVPRDLQRKFEQRWAARFAPRAPTGAPEKHQPERQAAPPAPALDQAKEKTRQIEAACLKQPASAA